MRGTFSFELQDRFRARVAFATLLIAAVFVAGCDRSLPLESDRITPDETRSVLGLIEITVSGLDGAEPHASVVSAPDVASLERLRRARVGGFAPQSLGVPTNTDASGNGTIQLEPVATGSFTDGDREDGGVRYLYATFRVRNAQTDGTPYDTPRNNLTFLAVADDGTLEETAFSSLLRFDGSPADAGIAQAILPTGSVQRAVDRVAVVPNGAGVLQVVTEAEAATILAEAPEGVTTVFPYGFVVSNPGTPGSRTLAANPAAEQFDGLVTFAFKVPLQATATDDPYTITAVFMAVDDTETRITESLEEQGTSSVQSGADALAGVDWVTLLGNSSTAVVGHPVRRICRVRTAGTDPNNPAATMVDAGVDCDPDEILLPSFAIAVDADAAPGGDGRSWATAFRYLQDALACVRDQSAPGQPCAGVTEIWVAEGTYYPDEGAGQTDNYEQSRYDLVEGVSLYGGFSGDETARDQRDWQAHPTILDGDLDQSGTHNENSALMILNLTGTGMRTVVVDGFTVRGSNSGGGAAIYCGDDVGVCGPTLRNLILTENTGENGAVVIASLAGRMAAPLFENVTFAANEGTVLGGAVTVVARSPAGTVMPAFVNSTFDGNSGERGGAIHLERTAGTLEIGLENVVFRNNVAASDGGAAYSIGATVHLANVEFWNNSAQTAGAIHATADSDIRITNSTLAGNTAASDGAVHMDTGALTVHNSILYGNAPEQVTGSGLASATAEFSLTEGGCPVLFDSCTDFIDADPLFLDLPGGDLRLGDASPAIDAGSNALLPADVFDLDGDGDTAEPLPLDLAGNARVVDGSASGTPVVDMGAYERQ